MQLIRNYWHGINPRHAGTLAAALLAAWALNDVLSWSAKVVIDTLLLGAYSLPDLVYRGKTGKWPRMDHPVGYIPALGWIAATCVWILPAMRADYLPPSTIIDALLVVLVAISLAAVLKRAAKRPAD